MEQGSDWIRLLMKFPTVSGIGNSKETRRKRHSSSIHHHSSTDIIHNLLHERSLSCLSFTQLSSKKATACIRRVLDASNIVTSAKKNARDTAKCYETIRLGLCFNMIQKDAVRFVVVMFNPRFEDMQPSNWGTCSCTPPPMNMEKATCVRV